MVGKTGSHRLSQRRAAYPCSKSGDYATHRLTTQAAFCRAGHQVQDLARQCRRARGRTDLETDTASTTARRGRRGEGSEAPSSAASCSN